MSLEVDDFVDFGVFATESTRKIVTTGTVSTPLRGGGGASLTVRWDRKGAEGGGPWIKCPPQDASADTPENHRPFGRSPDGPSRVRYSMPDRIVPLIASPTDIVPGTLCAILVTMALVLFATPPLPAAEPTFAEQAAAVRAGTSARIRVADRALTEEEWEEVAGLEGLSHLDLQEGVADDAKAIVLARLPRLERLVLRESPLGDEGFRHLAACHTLRDINLPQARCTLAGLAALAELPRLKNLRLGSPALCPEGKGGAELGMTLLQFPALRSLHLIDVVVGDAGLEGVARYDGLWNLYIDGAGISDEAWERYFALHPEVHVHVDQAHHDRDPNRHE